MRYWLSLFMVILLVGCGSSNKSLDESVFFKEVFPLTQSFESGDEYYYLAPRVDFKKYKQIYVAPVSVFDDEDGLQVNRLVTEQIKENYRLRLQRTIQQKGVEVVDEPVGGGVELHTAVTSIQIESDGFAFSDLLWPSFSGKDSLDSSNSSGQRHVEVRGEAFLRDTSAELTVAQFVSIKNGPTSAGSSSEITYNEVRPVIEHWTDQAGSWVCSLFVK